MKSNEKCPMKFGEYCYGQGDMTQCYYNLSDQCKAYEPQLPNVNFGDEGVWYDSFRSWFKANKDRVFQVDGKRVKFEECIAMPDNDVLIGMRDTEKFNAPLEYTYLSLIKFKWDGTLEFCF